MIKNIARKVANSADQMGFRRQIARAASIGMRFARRQQRFRVDSDGDWVNIQPDATFVSPNLLISLYPKKFEEIRDLWCHQYTPKLNDNVIDIGAGIGDEALVFSRLVGPKGRVIAVEAHPNTFACLEKTVAQSSLTNVTNCQVAAAEMDGVLYIENNGNEHIGNSVILDGGDVEIPAMTIDNLIAAQSLKHVSLLKMNIEGAETLAIKGMQAAREITDYLAISCHDFVADRLGASGEALRTREEVLDTLSGWGWHIARRPDDPRPWVRDYVYAKNPKIKG